MQHPKIFITNDDGIHSPGLRAAVEAVLPLGDVIVVAPSRQQTGMGRGFRGKPDEWLRPLEFHVNGHNIPAYHCDGSPALVVEHGVSLLCEQETPDLLISGINYGENLGTNITLSGTVGAALQGASMGIPAIAMSLQTDFAYHHTYGEVDWRVARHFLRMFAEKVLFQKLPQDVHVLKIDVPATASKETPWRITSVARCAYFSTFFENPTPDTTIGEVKYHVKLDEASLEQDSDIYALAVDQVVSVTPLSLDLTSRVDLQALHKNLNQHRTTE